MRLRGGGDWRAGRLPQPPPELAERLHVEDWIPATELVKLTADQALFLARRRWHDARDRWLAEHGIEARRGCELIPFRRPSFRSTVIE